MMHSPPPLRSPSSHKGENGKVAIIGGSPTIHGAPLLSALSAQSSGVDLLFLAVPACHAVIARSTSLHFQVHPFVGDTLSTKDASAILELLATMDCAVIGPGIDRTPPALRVLRSIISSAPCPLVLDASALQPWTLSVIDRTQTVLTPHLGELERMAIDPKDIGSVAEEYGITIHLKGHIDRIAAPDGSISEISGGNAGLTVGGTGDALAGLIAGLIAQGYDPLQACVTASTTIKRAACTLFGKFGYAFGTRRIIDQIGPVLHAMHTDER